MAEPSRVYGQTNEIDAPHVLNKRPRGVPSGPMEFDSDFRGDKSAARGTDLSAARSDFRGNDPYDTRGKLLVLYSYSCQRILLICI